ncbi:hypothetical protein JF531_09255 [Microbacterium esteraromaticum]|uniref:hypothetical protein n=1 Tax=Microbacterium esteraromaticum TaxID=57043 RepID=UPI001A8D1821|nr:hypothetical protein [Microbacterium esteraromaticum]MBN8424707.1 hypothetical protein [Microbacterium esteraromaticum]
MAASQAASAISARASGGLVEGVQRGHLADVRGEILQQQVFERPRIRRVGEQSIDQLVKITSAPRAMR